MDENDKLYLEKIKLLKEDINDIDFRELRFEYTKTSFYIPYGSKKDERIDVITAFKKKNYKLVIKLAEKVFERDFLDMNTHYMCMIAHQKLGNLEKMEFHKMVLNGLIDSIVSFGDGRSPETAYEVISTREEEFIITTLGFVTVTREEIRTKDHVIDKVFAASLDSGARKILYFNKDIPNKWLNNKYSSQKENSGI